MISDTDTQSQTPEPTPVDELVEESSFAERAEDALRDTFLRAKLQYALDTALANRARRVAEIPNWEDLRRAAHDIKMHTLDRLGDYLSEFIERAEAAGATVFIAEDATAARGYIHELARARGCERIVKSKSMVTEEIALTPSLIDAGFNVVESDLGEFIIQLAGEAPSHITAPIVHMSRQDVGRILEEKLGVPYTDRADVMTGVVKDHLRSAFLSSQMGITGANFLVAETGSVVTVENEGNLRLTTSIPPIHVAVAGIERVIPRWADLELFLTLLPGSAGGQRATGYTSVFTGPRRDDELGGPDELHIVLVDNGRSDILADDTLREALACIRCGVCLNVCPVYRRAGGHAYGYTYPGPIGKVLAADLWDAELGYDLAHASTLCGACFNVCPVRIDIPRMLLHLRRLAVAEASPTVAPRWAIRAFRWLMLHPSAYRSVARRILPLGQALFPWAPQLVARAWHEEREVPAIARESFGQLWRKTGGFTDE